VSGKPATDPRPPTLWWSFVHHGTASMFERHGFERTRRLGGHHRVVTKVVGSK
jgi:hypothetical protein